MAQQFKHEFKEITDVKSAELKKLVAEHGTFKLGEITLAQVFSGMKGMTGMIYETSKLDPEEGIRFRGFSIPELYEKLPKAAEGNQPLPEGLFYLMLTGKLPDAAIVKVISEEWEQRAEIPQHVFNTLDALPLTLHPMTQFSIGVLAMRSESAFGKAYDDGIHKKDYWDPTFEDCMNLIARLPRLAAYIYRRVYHNGNHIAPSKGLDWSANFAHMLGHNSDEVAELLRMYLTIHADHEGGNVSAHTTHLVGSALSDPFLSYAAGMNGLAGPLHGLANQEVIKWIYEMQESLGTDSPTKEQIAQYVQDTLTAGKVVPGYGHAVLRKTDPRFTAQMEFGKKHMPDDKLVNTVWNIYETVPPILQSLGKIKNPWPNVDAHSGALLVHYGLVEYEFYTVLFAVSRALGVLSSLCWDRALGFPLERPKSVTTESVKLWIAGKDEIWD